MLAGGSTSLSQEGSDFNEYRYQKALKEISKLINVNREIKAQSEQYQEENKHICQKYNEMVEINTNMEAEIYSLRETVAQLNQNFRSLEEFTHKIQQENHRKSLASEDNSEQLRNQLEIRQREIEFHEVKVKNQERQRQQQRIIEEQSEEITELNKKVEEMQSLEEENNKLHQEYQRVLIQNQEKEQKIEELNSTMLNLRVSTVSGNPDEALLEKLKVSEEWICSLNEEITKLKQKILEIECGKKRPALQNSVNETGLTRENPSGTQMYTPSKDLFSMQELYSQSSLSSAIAVQYVMKSYIKKIQKKMKRVQEERNKFESKYKKVKSREALLEIKLSQSDQKFQWLNKKVKGYENLTVRQQAEIERIIKEYSEQISNFSMKNRLLEQERAQLIEDISNLSSKKQQQPEPNCQLLPNASNNSKDAQTKVDANPISEDLINKQTATELKSVIHNLESQLYQSKQYDVEKQRLIENLQQKIDHLSLEKSEIIQVNESLKAQLDKIKSTDLSKTSKMYKKNEQILMKTQPLDRSGGKIFIINGKRYQTKLLGNAENEAQTERSALDSSEQLAEQVMFFDKQMQSAAYSNPHRVPHPLNENSGSAHYHQNQPLSDQFIQVNENRALNQLSNPNSEPKQFSVRKQSSAVPQMARNVIFNSGELQFTSSQRSYQSPVKFTTHTVERL